jgi:GST-like protein
MPTYGSRRKTCVAGGLHCGWAACPGGRRSLPLPPFRQSGFRSLGIGPLSFIVSTRFLRRTGRPSPGDAKAKANPMIDLYALTSPNVQKVYIMLEECALPYKEHFVDVWKGDQYGPEFSKINPNNKIPAIVDHEGPGGKPYTVIESGAILMYLAEKTGKFLPKDMAKKYDVTQWLMIQLTGVGPMFGQWTHFKLFAPKTGNDYSMARYTSEIKRLYELLEKRLGQAPYLGGQEYSIADIATFPWTRNHDAQGVKWEDNPNLARWFKAIEERPAVKAALAKIAAIKSNRETASDDDKDRFFNRGRYARA